MKRTSGILLPIFSLPSRYGIGTLGKEAYKFIDFLVEANQSYWQVLPIGHTSYGDSPYQAFSSFAGNPYFIDLDLLVQDGLLKRKELKEIWIEDLTRIDYGYLYENRYPILYKAYVRGIEKYRKGFEVFKEDNKWLYDYSMFMAIKKHFDMHSWLEWPDEAIRLRETKALKQYEEMLKDDIEFYAFLQYLFYKQYLELKKYANDHGIGIIGDLPIYVSLDSCEVWAEPKQFQLEIETHVPKEVAGVPPDYFSSDGQLWGNPLYDWDYMKKDHYSWWKKRLEGVGKYFDVIRIDHFRGFQAYWAVPYGAKTAKNGRWVDGPSKDFVDVLKNDFPNIQFIAEDLGDITEDVMELLKYSTFPGMRVLQFSMDPNGTSFHSPHHHVPNCICYIDTHDNVPIMGWVRTAKKEELNYAKSYYGLNQKEGYNFSFIRAGMNSVAELFVCQMQDYLGLDEKATINVPGTLGNWKWRLSGKELNKRLAKKISKIVHGCDRDRK
ncbi:MAG: 4-alpha-glucanotransferase [Erysipelotrichaceae bacterium]|nr:4-alpha-glucanotransferase [Erysipelotrichaceae bacterium]